MSDFENFLSRWSRLKGKEQAGGENPGPTAGGEEATPEGLRTAADDAGTPFDPSALPAVETIDAGSDIRAFLAPDVPEELKIAALRQAWAADPSIRDFVGLCEDLGDFNAPETILGFGPVEADRIQGLLERVLGEAGTPENKECPSVSVPESAPRTGTETGTSSTEDPGYPAPMALPHETSALSGSVSSDGGDDRSGSPDISQHDRIEAVSQEPRAMEAVEGSRPALRVRHGGALPR